MNEKKDFVESCVVRGVVRKKAEKAWIHFKDLKDDISNNWQLFKEMKYMSCQEKLILRNYAAEQGIEMTPDELNDLIEIIISLQDGMEEWKL